MVDALERELANRFAQVAAETLVEELGIDGACEQVELLLAGSDDDLRRMYSDIMVALGAMKAKGGERLAG